MKVPWLLLGALALPAVAADHPPVRLSLELACPDVAVDAAEVRRIVGVELRGAVFDAGGDTRWVTQISVRCAEGRLQLSVLDPVSRKSLGRSFALAEAPAAARARLVALAIAELVAASWTELAANPQPKVEPAPPPPPPALRAAAREMALERWSPPDEASPRARVRLLVEAGAHAFAGPLPLWGGGLRFCWERPQVLGVELDLHVDQGVWARPIGQVFIDRASGSVALHARLGAGAFTWRALAGARGGVVRLTGAAGSVPGTRAGSGTGPWAGLLVGGALALSGRGMSAELRVEGGMSVVGVVGMVDGAPAVRLDAPWVGLSLGVGLAP